MEQASHSWLLIQKPPEVPGKQYIHDPHIQNTFLSKQINQFSSGDQFGSESFHIELEIKGRSLTGQNTCMALTSSTCRRYRCCWSSLCDIIKGSKTSCLSGWLLKSGAEPFLVAFLSDLIFLFDVVKVHFCTIWGLFCTLCITTALSYTAESAVSV